MKLLMFLAKQFTFRPFEKTLAEAGDGGGAVQVHVTLTPFGWICEWNLPVFGESLTKVLKSL